MRHASFLLSIVVVFLAGCGDSGSDVDSGPHITLDGAADTGVTDAGTPDLGSDAGPIDMGPSGVCAMPVPPLPAADVPRCAAATRDCFDACSPTSATCGAACLAADTTAPVMIMGQTFGCSQCVAYQEFACFDAMMCHDAVAAFNCCAQAHCAATPTTACAMSMCMTEYNGLATCAGAHAATCVRSTGEFVTDCFGAATDGGTTTTDAGTATTDAG